MLAQEILSRNLRDRRAVAAITSLTGSPERSGKKRRESALESAAPCAAHAPERTLHRGMGYHVVSDLINHL